MRVLFLGKPLFYAIAFAIAYARFQAHGPHSKLPKWATILLATLARLGLGVAGFFAIVNWTSSDTVTFVGLPVLGFLWWLLVAKVFFWRTPPMQLVVFALIGEVLSAAIDIITIVDMRDFRFC